MELLYDSRDDAYHERLGSQILYWLDDLDAIPLDKAPRNAEGFLFAGARPISDYQDLVASRPNVRDRPEERALLRLDTVLQSLGRAGVAVPTPRTWLLPLDRSHRAWHEAVEHVIVTDRLDGTVALHPLLAGQPFPAGHVKRHTRASPPELSTQQRAVACRLQGHYSLPMIDTGA